MGEGVLDFARQAPPATPRTAPRPRPTSPRSAASHGPPGNSSVAPSSPSGGRRRARIAPSRASREKRRADAFRLGSGACAPRIGVGLARARRRASPAQRTGGAIGMARPADRRADVHQRLREVAGAFRGRQRRRRLGDRPARARERRLQGVKPRQDARDIAVDRRSLLVKGDRRHRGRGVGADAGQRAQRPPHCAGNVRRAARLPARRRGDCARGRNSRARRRR